MTVLVLALLCLAHTGFSQDFTCPHEEGFYPHATSCDKYWKCEAGQPQLKLCANGLAFADVDPDYLTESCNYLHLVNCEGRPEIEPPIGTPNCPRLYGIFADEKECDVFYTCWNGVANRYKCPPGLAYERKKRVCMWADEVEECTTQQPYECPAPGEVAAHGTFSRHAHPDDCRKYFVCIEGVAREYGCPIGMVFRIGVDDVSGQCSDPQDVPGCEDYYGNLDIKALARLGLRKK